MSRRDLKVSCAAFILEMGIPGLGPGWVRKAPAVHSGLTFLGRINEC